MKKKRFSCIGIILISALFVSGCSKTPERIKVGDVEKAISPKEEELISIMSNTPTYDPEYTVPVIDEITDKLIQREYPIGDNGYSLIIQATIEGEQLPRLPLAQVDMKPTLEPSLFIQTFLTEDESLVKFDSTTETYHYEEMKDEKSRELKLQVFENTIFFQNDTEMNQFSGNMPVSENENIDLIPENEAISLLQEKMDKLDKEIDIHEITIQKCMETERYFYEVFFTFNLSGRMLRANSLSNPGATALISNEGIFYLSGVMPGEVIESNEPLQIMSSDQLLEYIPSLFQEQIILEKNMHIDKISLQYILKSPLNNTCDIIPVWRLRVEQTELEKEQYGGMENNIYINAIDGHFEK